MEGAPIEPEGPVLSPRAARARRRRRRRAFGTVVFVLVAIGVLAAAYFAVSGSGDSGSSGRSADASSGSGPGAGAAAGATTTTITPPPPAGPFVLTDGVNVRTGPGTTFPSLGTISTGNQVMVVCVVDGQTVDGPKGPTNKWVKITGTNPAGFVTDQYVDTGAAIGDPKVIPVCPAQ
jgi:Bacterial SH3 domain